MGRCSITMKIVRGVFLWVHWAEIKNLSIVKESRIESDTDSFHEATITEHDGTVPFLRNDYGAVHGKVATTTLFRQQCDIDTVQRPPQFPQSSVDVYLPRRATDLVAEDLGRFTVDDGPFGSCIQQREIDLFHASYSASDSDGKTMEALLVTG